MGLLRFCGRFAAAGGSPARVEGPRATVQLAGAPVYDRGRAVDPPPDGLEKKVAGQGVTIEVDLGLGQGSATAWARGLSGGDRKEIELARQEAKEAREAVRQVRAELSLEEQLVRQLTEEQKKRKRQTKLVKKKPGKRVRKPKSR